MTAACSGTPAATTTLPSLASSPQAAIDELHRLLVAGEFGAAGQMTLKGHAALASLAEGATPSQVTEALRNGDAQVAANFWAGFAQGAGEAFLGEVEISSRGSVMEGERTFYLVEVVPQGLAPQRLVTQKLNGYLVDVFASFGGGLAERMILPVETLVGSSDPSAVLIMNELRDVVGSLMVAAADENQSPDSVQAILQLVELITRVG